MNSDKAVFDFIKNHLLRQNEKANHYGECLYATHLRKTKSEAHNQAVYSLFSLEMSKDISDLSESDLDCYLEEVQEKLLEEISFDSFCAVGCLFSIDKNFLANEAKLLEGLLIGEQNSPVLQGIEKLYPEWFITNDSISMLKSLQFIHDFKEPEEWNDFISSIEGCFTNDDPPEFIAKDIVWTEYGDQISNYINK